MAPRAPRAPQIGGKWGPLGPRAQGPLGPRAQGAQRAPLGPLGPTGAQRAQMGPWAQGPKGPRAQFGFQIWGLGPNFGARAWPRAQNLALGPKSGPWGRKYQSCPLKNHAESTTRYSKRSHMLQVMAENHFGLDGAKSQIPNPKSQVPSPKSQIPNPKSQVPSPKSQPKPMFANPGWGISEGNVSADKTSVVSADKTSVVSADKTSVVSLCQQTSPKTSPLAFPTQGRPLCGRPCVGNVEGGVLGDVC